MSLYNNFFRIETARLKEYNYSEPGFYYITLCTKRHKQCLGRITEGKVILTEMGAVADRCWREIPNHFPFVKLHDYVVMPDHIHGIIEICKIEKPSDCETDVNVHVETQNLASLRNIPTQPETQNLASLRKNSAQPGLKNKFGPQSRNIASIIRGFKIGVKKWANNNCVTFEWQPRYYDHIIRNEKDYLRIKDYIIKNPNNVIDSP